MVKTIEEKFNHEREVERINSAIKRLRNYKIKHPELKKGFI